MSGRSSPSDSTSVNGLDGAEPFRLTRSAKIRYNIAGTTISEVLPTQGVRFPAMWRSGAAVVKE